MGDFFGTDGIRGKANQYPLTADMAVRIGRAIGIIFGNADGGAPIILGRDTRQSGKMLESAVSAGICSAGTDVMLARIIPTPGVAFLTRNQEAGAGVVISASHNPFEDNGIKLFNPEGIKLSDREETQIETLIREDASESLQGALPNRIGSIQTMKDSRKHYLEFLLRTLPPDFHLDGLKIVIDCSHGAVSAVAPTLFDTLGADLSILHNLPNGTNINDQCGSEHPETLSLKVRETGADLGLAFDGDGDRMIAVDSSGRVLTGDQLLAIGARFLQKRGQLANQVLVSTVMSNFGLKESLRRIGVRHITSDVGDRHVMEKMVACDASLGGEDSGHMIYRAYHSTGDGLLSALKLIEAITEADRPLSEMADCMTVYPQVLTNIQVRDKPDLTTIDAISDAIQTAERKLGDQGRVLVRYSGTQQVCRIMVEGQSHDTAEECAQIISSAVSDAIGA